MGELTRGPDMLQAALGGLAKDMLESSSRGWKRMSAGRLNSPVTQTQNQGLKLALPNIHLIYELLEH